MRLKELAIGQKGLIQDIDDMCINKKRLIERGFTKDAVIIPLYRNIGNSMTAYSIKGTVIALRHSDSIFVNINEVIAGE